MKIFTWVVSYLFMVTVVTYLFMLGNFLKYIEKNNIKFWNELGCPKIFDFAGDSGFNMTLFFCSDLSAKVSADELKRIFLLRRLCYLGVFFFIIMNASFLYDAPSL